MNALEKIAFAAVLIGTAFPSFARAEKAPAPKVDLALQRALASPLDRHGIPQDLYDLDAELAGFRLALEQSAPGGIVLLRW